MVMSIKEDEPSTNSKVGDLVAVEPQSQQSNFIYIAQVQQVHYEQQMVEVHLYHVPAHARFGPWQRRPWVLWPTSDGQPRTEIIPMAEVLCRVSLRDDALDMTSLMTLSKCGIDVGSTPHRDRNLPPAQC